MATMTERRADQAAWRAVDPGEVSRLPVERRLLIAASEIRPDDLLRGLTALIPVYSRALGSATGSLRAELRQNVVECRRLALLISLARELWYVSGPTVSLPDCALEIARQADLALADPEFSDGARDEVAEGVRRAWALADFLAAEAVTGRYP